MNNFTYIHNLLIDSGLNVALGNIHWLFYLKKSGNIDFNRREEADVIITLFDLQDNLKGVLFYAQNNNHKHTKQS